MAASRYRACGSGLDGVPPSAHTINCGAGVLDVPGSRVKLLTLTEAGEQYAHKHNITVASFGRAGLEHEFWRARLKERCEARGYTVTREYHLGEGKHVDLHA